MNEPSSPSPAAAGESYLSVFVRKENSGLDHQVGVAMYNTSTETIKLSQFRGLDPLFELIQQLEPTAIVSVARPGEELHSLLRRNNMDPVNPFEVVTYRSSEFAMGSAKHRLSMLEATEMDGFGSVASAAAAAAASSPSPANEVTRRSRRNLKLMSYLNLYDSSMIQACGGLLTYLSKNHVLNQFGEDDDAPGDTTTVRKIELLALEHQVQVDRRTKYALNVFADEYLDTKRKEGLSLFGLLDRTKSSGGRRLLRSWLHHPTRQLSALQDRLDHVEFFALPQNGDLVDQVRLSLGQIGDPLGALNRFTARTAAARSWTTLASALENMIALHDLAGRIVAHAGPAAPRLFQLLAATGGDSDFAQHVSALGQLSQTLHSVVDLSLTRASSELVIRAGVSPDLDRLRMVLDNLDNTLTQVCVEDMANNVFPAPFGEVAYKYIPQVGFLVSIDPANYSGEPVPDFEHVWTTESDVYLRNKRCGELNELIGDIQAKIADLEASFAMQLEEVIIGCADSIAAATGACCELDALIAMALAAVELHLTRPELHENPAVLHITRGRHLLQELCCDVDSQFIPNDTPQAVDERGAPTGCVDVITGPNNSGKSVYLRQVGTIVYLAHCGSFVPAEHAAIGLTDRIFTRMHSSSSSASSFAKGATVQSRQANAVSTLSTFAHDTSQMAYALRHLTAASLVLIDEYGKGTAALDGAALLAATCQHIARRSDGAPKAFFATHFHELLRYRVLDDIPRVRFFNMTVMVKAQQPAASNQELVFLYRLAKGKCTDSYGVHCAQVAGVPEDVLARALHITQCVRDRKPVERRNVPEEERAVKRHLLREFEALDVGEDAAVDAFLERIDEARGGGAEKAE